MFGGPVAQLVTLPPLGDVITADLLAVRRGPKAVSKSFGLTTPATRVARQRGHTLTASASSAVDPRKLLPCLIAHPPRHDTTRHDTTDSLAEGRSAHRAPGGLARRSAANEAVWLADLTYVPTGEGWSYPAAILDMHTRKAPSS